VLNSCIIQVPLPGTPLYREIEKEGQRIDWTRENNMCIDSCYSRHIPADVFRTVMERLGEYATDYNKSHSDGHSWRDRRLRDGYEEDNPNAGGAVPADGSRPFELSWAPEDGCCAVDRAGYSGDDQETLCRLTPPANVMGMKQ
jgi:hypothetical protein